MIRDPLNKKVIQKISCLEDDFSEPLNPLLSLEIEEGETDEDDED